MYIRATSLLVILLFLPHHAFAAWTATEGFEGYSGDLTGENGGSGWSAAWSGDVLYDVGTTVVYEASTAGVMTAGATEPVIGRTLTTSMTDGSVRYAVRRNTTTNGGFNMILTSGAVTWANKAFYVNLSGGASANLNGTSIGTYVINTWHYIDVEFDCTTDQARAALDGDSFTSWVAFSATKTSLDGLGFTFSASGPSSTQYFDAIAATPSAATPAGEEYTIIF